MRVTSDIWVHVFLRREADRGAFATVIQKGAIEAGAIYCIENSQDGKFKLFAPAPQMFLTDENDDRKFEQVLETEAESEIDAYLQRQKKFDPDIWIIETQCREGPLSIDVIETETKPI